LCLSFSRLIAHTSRSSSSSSPPSSASCIVLTKHHITMLLVPARRRGLLASKPHLEWRDLLWVSEEEDIK
jgi:hypothetical protein